MTTKKRLLLLAVLPLTIVVMLGILAMLPARPGVTKANFDRIQVGMTKAEVEQIFDGEAGKQLLTTAVAGLPDMPVEKKAYWWGDEERSVAVVIFENDVVIRKEWGESDETVMQRICRWLHLR
jgi:hypothetical protein